MKDGKIVVLLMAILLVMPLVRAGSVESTSSSADADIKSTTTTDSSNSLSTTYTNTGITPTPVNTGDENEGSDDSINDTGNNTKLSPGDIIFEYWELIKIDGVDVDHAALYVGDGRLVEADPHMDKWPGIEKGLYKFMEYVYHVNKRKNPSFQLGPRFKKFIYELQNRSYSGNTNYGNVEEEGFGEVNRAPYCYYGKVYVDAINNTPVDNTTRYKAVDYAEERAAPKWPLIKENGFVLLNQSRPFDYVSPWIKDEKQYDEYTVKMVLNNLSLAKTLDYGYGCSELVWAAWWHATKNAPKEKKIDLDGDNSLYNYVWPWEIKDNKKHVRIIYNRSDESSNANDIHTISLNHTMSLKLVYTDKTVYVDDPEDIEEVNGEYYLKTSDDELYSLNNITDLEIVQQNL